MLGFILAFGHQLNDVLTRSLAMRYENIDLIDELKGEVARGARRARRRRGRQSRARASSWPRRATTCGSRCTRSGSTSRRWPRARTERRWRPLVGSVQRAVAALEGQFEQLLDLSRLEAGALHAGARARRRSRPLFARVAARAAAAGGRRSG